MSNNEMCNNKNVNIWPLNHKELTYCVKKLDRSINLTHDLKMKKLTKKSFLLENLLNLRTFKFFQILFKS